MQPRLMVVCRSRPPGTWEVNVKGAAKLGCLCTVSPGLALEQGTEEAHSQV